MKKFSSGWNTPILPGRFFNTSRAAMVVLAADQNIGNLVVRDNVVFEKTEEGFARVLTLKDNATAVAFAEAHETEPTEEGRQKVYQEYQKLSKQPPTTPPAGKSPGKASPQQSLLDKYQKIRGSEKAEVKDFRGTPFGAMAYIWNSFPTKEKVTEKGVESESVHVRHKGIMITYNGSPIRDFPLRGGTFGDSSSKDPSSAMLAERQTEESMTQMLTTQYKLQPEVVSSLIGFLGISRVQSPGPTLPTSPGAAKITNMPGTLQMPPSVEKKLREKQIDEKTAWQETAALYYMNGKKELGDQARQKALGL